MKSALNRDKVEHPVEIQRCIYVKLRSSSRQWQHLYRHPRLGSRRAAMTSGSVFLCLARFLLQSGQRLSESLWGAIQ